MMYCLRTFLPLLLLPLPLSLSPIHLTTLLILTYILNKPCAYCSLLLVILFASSCHWSGRCFWSVPSSSSADPSSLYYHAGNATAVPLQDLGWLPYFLPRLYTTPFPGSTSTNNATAYGEDHQLAAFLLDVANSTISMLASSAVTSVANATGGLVGKVAPGSISIPPTSAAGGVGTQWLRNLLGQSEWTVPCVGVKLVL
jgi:hypothetical protein